MVWAVISIQSSAGIQTSGRHGGGLEVRLHGSGRRSRRGTARTRGRGWQGGAEAGGAKGRGGMGVQWTAVRAVMKGSEGIPEHSAMGEGVGAAA